MSKSEPSQFEYFQMLAALGETASLNFNIDTTNFNQQLGLVTNEWHTYNPRKLGFNRQGLSLTSLDGGSSGIPDLDSVREYNRINKTHYQEKDFNTPTAALEKLSSLKELFDFYKGSLGRCHLIKLGRGGFFPPHRDVVGPTTDSFRILVMLNNANESDYGFILNNKSVYFKLGWAYFVNTMLTHSVFSYNEDHIFLVMNIILNNDSIKKTIEKLSIK